MIRFLLILLLPLFLNASKILSYNIYDRTDRVDVMITFDTPYDGVIKQNTTPSKISIKLEDAQIEASKTKQLSSTLVKTLKIVPMGNYTEIIAFVPSSTVLKASKTADSYGLRLRFMLKKNTSQQVSTTTKSQTTTSTLPTQKGLEISTSYYVVVAFLIFGIVVLFMLKKSVLNKENRNLTNSWMKKKPDKQAPQENKVNPPSLNNSDEVTIRFQKQLNENNSVVLLDYGKYSYLFVMGENSVLLDKFTDDKPTTQSEFDNILATQYQELDNYKQIEEKQTFNTPLDRTREAIEAYKERASYSAADEF